MFSKKSLIWIALAVLACLLLIAGGAIARNGKVAGHEGESILPAIGVNSHGRGGTLDEEYTQLRYVKTTDYGATWSPLTAAGDLGTFAATVGKFPDFSAVTTATNELCYAIILHRAATPGAYSMTGPTFTPVLAMSEGTNSFDTGYNMAGGRTDIGRCVNGDLIMIIWGHDSGGLNTLWAVKSTNNGQSWGTPWVAANESMIGAEDAANYTHMFHLSARNPNDVAFAIYQVQGVDGYNQYVLRIPTAGGLGTITTISEYAGHPFSYIFPACQPIAYDATNNALFVSFYNHDRSGGFVYYSNNNGQTFSQEANRGVAGTRYPSMALQPGTGGNPGYPFLTMNMTVTQASGQRVCVWDTYDEGGYHGGQWTPADSVACVTTNGAGSTGGGLYIANMYFWDDTRGVCSMNSWDAPQKGERMYTERTTDGAENWTGMSVRWDYVVDTLNAYTMQNGQLIGGSNGVAYVITCARKGNTDAVLPTVTQMTLLTSPTSTGPWAVKAFYDDNEGILNTDPSRGPWVNWMSPGGSETYALSDSMQLTIPGRNVGWYFFTIPDTNAEGAHWAVNDTVEFYCDGYDQSENYGNSWHQYIIVGNTWLGIEGNSVASTEKFQLNGNYPNPFNPTTRIDFALPADLRVTLKVYNTLGQQAMTLADGKMLSAGLHSVTFNASGLPSGVYFYTLQAGTYSASQKMVLLK